ncbi:MAG TPA: head GIN domain-containing protein [Prolixibacteraceae bacterium]
MNKKTSYILMLALLVTFTLSAGSCIPHIHGNGKVVKEERNVSNFESVSVGSGIELLINQDSFEKVVVEADENIMKILKTEVSGGKLKIFMEEGVLHAKKMKVYVTLKTLKSLECSSGSETKSAGKINAENLTIHASSGSGVNMEISCNQLKAESSSGSSLRVSGTAQSVNADSSSGSEINASELVAEMGEASASSGANLKVNVTKAIKAHCSSGAQINVSGNPTSRDTDSSSGGSVHFK